MNPLKKIALAATLAVDAPRRRRRMDRWSSQNRAPMSVLFYHRVADECLNGWTISTMEFARHVEYCQANFDLVSLDEVQRRLRERHSPRPSVTFTFDDGYAENSRFALPLLIRERIPCTYFVTTAHIRESKAFQHDLDAGHALPVNSIEQLCVAADAGIEIGLHTANHVDFACVNTQAELDREIIDAKVELEAMIGREVRHFAVPFGLPKQMRPAVFATAKRAGLQGVCSAYGAYNLIGDDAFHIRRMHGDSEFVRLRNWLSFDLRKVRKAPALSSEEKNHSNESVEVASDSLAEPTL